MRNLIKILAHAGIISIYVYVFYFATSLVSNSWLNWTWTISTGILLIFNCFVLYAFCTADEKEERDLISVFGILLEALITISIVCKIMSFQNEDLGFILLPFVLYLFFSGINKYALSYSFMFGSILYYVHYIEFSTWHSYVCFICLIIAHLLVIFSLANELGDEDGEDLKLNRLGLLIIPVIIAYMYYYSAFLLITEYQVISLLVYILLGFAVSMKDNIITFGVSPFLIISYSLLFIFEWHPLYSWLVFGLTAVYGVLFYIAFKIYRSYNEGLVRYLADEYTSLGDNYKQLIGEYNELVSFVNNNTPGNQRSEFRDNNVGREMSKGFWRGVGRILAGTLLGGSF